MIEPEMAFYELPDNMRLAEEFLKYIIRSVLEHCREDLEFFNQFIEKSVLATLEHVAESSFGHITYTEAITELKKSGRSWEFPAEWGNDLQTEHERFLSEEVFKKPLIVTDYPKAIKAFYMRANDDDKTVRAMDVLVPRVGEIIGGSQREERHDVLLQRLRDAGLDEKLWLVPRPATLRHGAARGLWLRFRESSRLCHGPHQCARCDSVSAHARKRGVLIESCASAPRGDARQSFRETI